MNDTAAAATPDSPAPSPRSTAGARRGARLGRWVPIAAAALALAAAAVAQDVVVAPGPANAMVRAGAPIPLQGRVPGEPAYSGPGQFKFALFRTLPDGRQRQVWNSAQGTADAALAEPAGHLILDVRDGRYALRLGDGVLTPPVPPPPAYFGLAGAVPGWLLRVWFRGADGAFRVVAPDIPIDGTPLSREAALAWDADRLEGRNGAFYLDRANHVGAVPFVESVNVPSWQTLGGDYPVEQPVRMHSPDDHWGCGEYKLASIFVDAPSEGTVVIFANANLLGVAKTANEGCGTRRTLRLCVPAVPDVRAPNLPAVPSGSPPGANVPRVEPPALPGRMPSVGAGLLAPKSPADTDWCLPGELTYTEGDGVSTRHDSYGGAALWLFRPDQPQGERVLSYTRTEFTSRVMIGWRLDVSSTIRVAAGRSEFQLFGYMDSTAGFGERNLTAIFIPSH